MKVNTFIPPNVATNLFGSDYIAHAKCGKCRYVLRSLGTDQFLIARESGPVLAARSDHVGGFSVVLGTAYDALCRFIAILMRKGIGVHRLVAVKGTLSQLN